MKSAIRNASVAAAALLLGLSITAIARAQDKPTLAFVVNVASDFWKAAEAGVKKAQGELPDYTLELKYPEQASVAIQQRLMDDLVTAGVKAHHGLGRRSQDLDRRAEQDRLARRRCSPPTPTPRRPSASPISARPTSMPASRRPKSPRRRCPNGGKCIGFVGLLGADNAKERIQGFKDGVAGTKIELIDVRGDDVDQARGQEERRGRAGRQPRRHLHGRLLLLQHAAHLRSAASDAGKLGQITVVGFDDDPITLGGVKEGTIAGTVVQQPFEWAYQGMKLMAAYLKGDKSGIPADGLIIIPTKIIGKADVDAYAANLKAMAGN